MSKQVNYKKLMESSN